MQKRTHAGSRGCKGEGMGEQDETEPLVQAMHRQLLASQLDKLGLRRLSTKRHQETDDEELRWKGAAMVLCATGMFLAFCVTAFLTKLFPSTGLWLWDLSGADDYYCYLIPLSILPTFAAIYVNWLSMRIFEHN